MWPCPFQGQFVIHRLGTATIKLYIKFEVHSSTMKILEAMQNVEMGGLGGYGLPKSPFNRAHTTFLFDLIETMRLSCTILELQQVICQKSPISTYHTCIWHPRWGWPYSNFAKISASENRLPVLLCGTVFMSLCLAVLTQYWHGTDDGQTDTRWQLILCYHSVVQFELSNFFDYRISDIMISSVHCYRHS